jgi:hypothetical protein
MHFTLKVEKSVRSEEFGMQDSMLGPVSNLDSGNLSRFMRSESNVRKYTSDINLVRSGARRFYSMQFLICCLGRFTSSINEAAESHVYNRSRTQLQNCIQHNESNRRRKNTYEPS